MKPEDAELVRKIKTKIADYDKQLAEREQKEKESTAEKDKELTTEDVQRFLNIVNVAKTKDQPNVPEQRIIQQQPLNQSMVQQQPVKKTLTKDEQIALQVWKDAKATSIVCLIAIVLPFIGILIAMAKNGAMYAMIIALAGIVYPCVVFVKSVFIQKRAYLKYGLKPMFQLPQQQSMFQQNRGEMF